MGSSIGASAIGAGDSSGGLAACGLFPAELDLAFTGSFVGGRPGLRVGGVTTSMLALTLTVLLRFNCYWHLENHCTRNNRTFSGLCEAHGDQSLTHYIDSSFGEL